MALPESREESACQLQPRPLQSPSLTLGCQRCGGNGAAAPVSDVMLRSSFSAPLPSSVEDAAAIAAEQQRSGSASLAALGAFGGRADPLCKCKVTARLQEDVCDTAGVSDSRWVQAVGLHLNMSRQNPPPRRLRAREHRAGCPFLEAVRAKGRRELIQPRTGLTIGGTSGGFKSSS